jgi:AAA+ superfamily predicted ATPase
MDELGCMPGEPGLDSEFAKLNILRNAFLLTSEEVSILSFCYCYRQSRAMEALLDHENENVQIRLMSYMLRISPGSIRKSLNLNGRLVQFGLLEIESRTICFDFEVKRPIMDFLNGFSDLNLLERFCAQYTGDSYDIDTFDVAPSKLEIVRSLILSNQPCNILLQGEAGTGKTEFAKAIARACGKRACFVKHEKTSEQADKRVSLQVADRTIDRHNGIVVIDEADWMINTWRVFWHKKDPLDKEWLNDFLDRSSAQFIWIVNEIDFIDQSVLRRFTYHLQFRRFTRCQRSNAWHRILAGKPVEALFTDDYIEYLADTYEINVSGIDLALRIVSQLEPVNKDDPEQVKEYVEEVLANHRKFVYGKSKPNNTHVQKRYDLESLNLDADVHDLIKSLEQFYRRAEAEPRRTQEGFTALFWGAPGTGKTQFARYLAYILKREIHCKRVSDLLNPFVGMTEKCIRDAFDEAEEENAILLLDEADSLFINRENALRSWEISQTNELLTQMNNFQGVLICCTNLLGILDTASIRRFDWKVEFKPLTQEGRVSVYRKYFSDCIHMEDRHLRKLAGLADLTFGDVYAVWRRFRFAEKKKLSHDRILEAIKKEAEYRKNLQGRKVGFL